MSEANAQNRTAKADLQNHWVRFPLVLLCAFAGFALGHWAFGLQSNRAFGVALLFQWGCQYVLNRITPLPESPAEEQKAHVETILLFVAVAVFLFIVVIVVSDFTHSY